ncbi:SH3 domain-containing protein [Streptomyces sp. NPDC003247]|uniref:SH3 domain-containing protein n=1 Tax=Streptomyces sp. NPDC003247 TaxID=3364677 RepID=UPI00369933D0
MRSHRFAIFAAMVGALALPVLSAPAANAAPAADAATIASSSSCRSLPPLPYTVHTKAVTIRSKATTKSAAVGVLYKSHKFIVHKSRGNWRHITDKTTGIKGWVSGTYVYRDVRMCLD